MKKNILPGLVIVLSAAVVLAVSSAYTVQQTQYAMVTRFGAVRSLTASPGLHFKVPFIETVTYYDKRVLDLNLQPQTILLNDQQNLEVDAFLRFQIVDALKFFQGAKTMKGARELMTGWATSAMLNVLASSSRDAIVRSNRANLMKDIQQQMKDNAESIGVRVIDLRLTRVDLPAANSKAVFDRMVSERQREAADYRAQGNQKATELQAKADRDATIIRAEAERQAQELRGQGDADKNKVLAESFGSDPEFFAFMRSMQAYQTGLTADKTNLVLSPNSEFFRYFRNPNGGDKSLSLPAPLPGNSTKPPAVQ